MKTRKNSMAGLFSGNGEGAKHHRHTTGVRFRSKQMSKAERWERRSHRILSSEPLPLDESTMLGAVKPKYRVGAVDYVIEL
eukprot:CAMPEP_0114384096 /NCGR_PEP_ID=MMETSP0102-20121206/5149_1 /TAXON_ID=38822 ORGANISM="Pteridomonas danica, Strain PT" /NCGR_SAMPLE_ID=MMETSP0102 /ASSEMBLY_ACC=CAM_ASM_000212 /LENGTH=80 /DNA_ID=CAMNT_0001540319 /DNA_START=1 /DNA_END=240 /DNA_ORIENTATION=+